MLRVFHPYLPVGFRAEGKHEEGKIVTWHVQRTGRICGASITKY